MNEIEIIIDEEFKGLLPKLDAETFAWLEDNILQYGCREPLVLWNGRLIDGHNRFEILTRHELPVNTVSLEFDSRDDVIIWIISTQVSRRNLNPMQLSYYRGLHYNTDKKVQGTSNQFSNKSEKSQNETFHRSTASRLADRYNVSRATIARDAQIANALSAIGETSPDIKADILSGKQRISRKQLQELAAGTEEDVTAMVSQIVDGTFESRKTPVAEGKESKSTADLYEMRPWELQFSRMTDEFRLLMRGYAQTNDTSAAKTALRQYIGMLEELLGSI